MDCLSRWDECLTHGTGDDDCFPSLGVLWLGGIDCLVCVVMLCLCEAWIRLLCEHFEPVVVGSSGSLSMRLYGSEIVA